MYCPVVVNIEAGGGAFVAGGGVVGSSVIFGDFGIGMSEGDFGGDQSGISTA